MDIWIIRDGEKTGPIHDFEIRKKIEAGELLSTTPAWHEGLPAWKPLGEIGLFEREFDRPFESHEAPESPSDEPEKKPVPPPLPDHLFSLRRFWARWFDLYLYAGIFWFAMWAAGRDIGLALMNPWIVLFQFVPWFALEAVLLHRYGFTPGKWLLGLRVVNNAGTLMNLAESTRRSARVSFVGIGFGLDIVTIVCQIMAYFSTKRLGRPLWDHAGGHRIVAAPHEPWRIAVFVAILFASLALRLMVLMPYVMEEAAKTSPEIRELRERYPQWLKPRQ